MKAAADMDVTVLGIVTPVNPLLKNAIAPIVVTFLPPNWLGIVIFFSVQSYETISAPASGVVCGDSKASKCNSIASKVLIAPLFAIAWSKFYLLEQEVAIWSCVCWELIISSGVPCEVYR